MEGVIHRDIAARNFLLDAHNNVFVCDFGLARVKTGLYQRTASSLGPVKYMAPESIAKKQYSEASDAWSFGVYMWEVTHVQEPFENCEVFDVAIGVVSGALRLPIEAAVAAAYGR
jgi:serine/threonine protein kinase